MSAFSVTKLKKQKYFNHFIIAFTLLIISLIIYVIVHIYAISLEETKRSHQEKQLEIAKSAASGISNYLAYLYNELEFFSQNNYPSAYFEQLYKSKDKKGILKSVFHVDSTGKLLSNVGTLLSSPIKRSIKKEISKLSENFNLTSLYSEVYSVSNNNYDSLYLCNKFQLVSK